jgi:hypothetical protein
MPESAVPTYITSLIRHFADLRDGTHGGSASRKGKESHFEKAVQLLAPVARQVLTEMNTSLLRHRAAHRDGTTTHRRWRFERGVDFELA